MAVPGIPFLIEVIKSLSVGGLPDGVLRILNKPLVKSLGLGYKR